MVFCTICLLGASENFFNLASVGDWTGNRSSSDETKDDVLDFDGFEDAIVIDAEKFQYNVGSKFTIVTWMKHSAEFDLTQDKEQILCYSDSRGYTLSFLTANRVCFQ